MRLDLGEKFVPALLCSFGEGLDVLDGVVVANVLHVLLGGRSEHGDYSLDLI